MDYARLLNKTAQHNDLAEHIYAKLYAKEGPQLVILTAMGNHYQRRQMYDLAAACFGRAMVRADADFYCHKRYMELADMHDARFSSASWQKFEDRVRLAAKAPIAQAAVAAPALKLVAVA